MYIRAATKQKIEDVASKLDTGVPRRHPGQVLSAHEPRIIQDRFEV